MPKSASNTGSSPGISGAPRRTVAVLGAGVVVLVGASIGLWAILDEEPAGSSGREALLLTLFSCAGALGAVLRSFAYLLAFGNFSRREQVQWRRETLIGPLLGLMAGFVAFLIVDGLLVGEGDPNHAGQFLVSLGSGAVALGQAGRVVERGILRGTLNRSGIMGGETSPAAPLLQRLEQTLEQRVADLTVVNYDGFVIARTIPLGASQWTLEVTFDSRKPTGEDKGFESAAVGRLSIGGGVEHDFVNFNLSVVSDRVTSSPLVLTVTAPRTDRSEPATFVLEMYDTASDEQTASARRAAILEVGQGSQIIQVIPLMLPLGTTHAEFESG